MDAIVEVYILSFCRGRRLGSSSWDARGEIILQLHTCIKCLGKLNNITTYIIFRLVLRITLTWQGTPPILGNEQSWKI